jgi:hypothetical protein
MAKSIEVIVRHQQRSWRDRDCRGMDLSGLDLRNVDFTDAILDGANLSGADVRGAVFRRSSLVGANLSKIRSGLTQNRLLLIKNIFTVLMSLGTTSVVFTSSSIASFVIDEIKILTVSSQIDNLMPWHPIAGWLSLITGAVYTIVLLRRNPGKAIAIAGLSAFGMQSIVAFIVIQICLQNGQPWKVTGDIIIGIVSLSTMLVSQIVFYTALLALIKIQVRSPKWANLAALIGIAFAIVSIYSASKYPGYLRLYVVELIIASIAAGLMYITWHIGRQIELKSPDYRLLLWASDYISTFFGTCFDRANLTDANLEYADLSDANLTDANLTRTNLYGCQQIETARLDRTPLADKRVRDLLVSHHGENNSYVNCKGLI